MISSDENLSEKRICVTCGQPFAVPKTSKQRRCALCNGRHIAKVIRQLQRKSGQYYNKWKTALRKSL